MPRGRDGLIYFANRLSITETFTNVDNDKFVVSTANFIDKDLRVTDNGDGTLTILILSTGNAVVYNSDGEAIGRNPGQVRFELLVDHGGTPSDPSDDTEISFEQVKESTGRTDDFCEVAVPAQAERKLGGRATWSRPPNNGGGASAPCSSRGLLHA